MTSRAVCFCLALGLPGPLDSAAMPAEDPDPEVVRGVEQVEEGEYDSAILTLDAAVRRLADKPELPGQLGQAYLYLGIAYLGKGHETLAKAQFREALARVSDLRLSPEMFAPRVIEIFEKARDEVTKPREASKPRKGGSKKGLILLGVGGAAAAGIAAAASGGGGGGSAATPTTTLPPDTRTVATFSGTITPQGGSVFTVQVGATGVLDAIVSWSPPSLYLRVHLHEANTGRFVTFSARSGPAEARLSTSVTPQLYRFNTFITDENNAQAPVIPGNATFTLTVRHP